MLQDKSFMSNAMSNSEPKGARSTFRHDINALRAIAVISVVLFHFDLPGFNGGFSGVDIFFVISGFLMTKIITEGLDAQRFSVVGFYMARARRIIPALFVVSVIVLTFGILWVDPQTYRAMSRNVFSSILFISNFDYASAGGYFSGLPESNWMLHTWSLSVEWQFYLIYPLLFLLLELVKVPRRHRALILAIAGGISLVIAIGTLLTRSDMALRLSFYLLPARAWEMIAGGLVVLLPSPPQKSQKYYVFLGLALILISIFGFSTGIPWPGIGATLPVLGTALVIAGNISDAAWSRIPGVREIGRWSYSIYLVHWPIVAAIFYFHLPRTLWAIVLYIVASIVAGAISYELVERRLTSKIFINRTLPDAQRVLVPVGILLVLCGAFYATKGLEDLRMPKGPAARETIARLEEAKGDWTYPKDCAQYRVTETRLQLCRQGGGGKVAALVVGDSFAQQLTARYRDLPRGKDDPAIIFATKAGCPLLPGSQLAGSIIDCAASTNEALDMASTGPYPAVIVAVSWFGAVGQEPGSHRRGRICFQVGHFCRNSANPEVYLADATDAFEALGARLAAARGRSANVSILGLFPREAGSGPGSLYRTFYEKRYIAPDASFNAGEFYARMEYPNKLLKIASVRADAKLVEPSAYMCSSGSCPTMIQGQAIYFDDTHIRASTAAGPDLKFLDELTGLSGPP